MLADDLHPGEEHVKVRGDQLLERDGTPAIRQGNEARQQRWDFDAGKTHLMAHGVADHHRQVEREVRDVGERMRRVDGERCENGKDAGAKLGGEEVTVRLIQLGHPGDRDPVLFERGRHPVREEIGAALEQAARSLVDGPQLLTRGHAIG